MPLIARLQKLVNRAGDFGDAGFDSVVRDRRIGKPVEMRWSDLTMKESRARLNQNSTLFEFFGQLPGIDRFGGFHPESAATIDALSGDGQPRMGNCSFHDFTPPVQDIPHSADLGIIMAQ